MQGESIVAAQYFATLSTTPWPDEWPRPANDTTSALVYRVEGRPNLRMQLYFDPQSGEDRLNSAIPLTAMAAVNAIPAVVRADPGIIDQPLHGPEIVSRQARAARAMADAVTPLRVAHFGTGQTGMVVLRQLLARNDIELVGHLVHSPDKSARIPVCWPAASRSASCDRRLRRVLRA